MQQPNLILSQKLKQEQVLAPAQIQSLEILMAPVMELQAKISQELSSNPVLEQDDGSILYESETGVSWDMRPAGSLEQGDSKAEAPDDDDIESYGIDRDGGAGNELGSESRHGEEAETEPMLRDGYDTSSYGGYSDKDKIDYFINSIVDAGTRSQDLQFQLDMIDIDKRIKPIAEIIIGSLDDKGYLNTSLQDIASSSGYTIPETEKALEIVQSFDPAGVGARNLRECLLLQLKRKGINSIPVNEVVDKYLDDIAANHLPQVAKKLNISIDELDKILKLIKTLSPYPYSETGDKAAAEVVVPEITIEKDKSGRYIVVMEEKYQPRLRISGRYINMLESQGISPEIREYIKKKISAAGVIIRSIEQRRDTIKKLAEVIVDTQYDFFENGLEHLKPLTMKQVADKIGVHETTVSRAVSGKYALTPQGTYELKFFFSSGYTSDTGDMISNKVVMEKIKDIIDGEDPYCPWSDDAISDILNKTGIPVARRTIAKYREEMKIPSSRLRRQFNT